MIELEPYSRAHLADFTPRDEDRRNVTLLRMEQGWDGNAVTAREDGRTLGICGFALSGDTAKAWIVLSDDLAARPVTITRLAKHALPFLAQLPGVKRIEGEVSTPAARKWAEWLGFEYRDGVVTWQQQPASG